MSWVITITEAMVAVILINVGTFYYIMPDGSYGVGHRQAVLKGETSPSVSVFYPIEMEDYKNMRHKDQYNTPLLLDGYNDVKGLSNGFTSVPRFFMSDYTLFRLKAVVGQPLHKDFSTGGSKLTPVIISHDLMQNRTSLACTVLQLVSYGCIVYCLNHTDGSATYHKDYTVTPPQDVYYQTYSKVVHKFPVGRFRMNQTEHRLKDIKLVIDMIKSEAKNEVSSIDMEKLTIMGYSMGAMTAIESCYQFNRDFKLCVALDPYFSARAETITDSDIYAIEQPIQILTNQDYPDHSSVADYNHREVCKKFFESTVKLNGNANNYTMMLKDSSHLVNSDISLYYSVIFKLFGLVPFITDIENEYKYSRDLILDFMIMHKFIPIKVDNKPKRRPNANEFNE
jgi:dienelactone hydrolase